MHSGSDRSNTEVLKAVQVASQILLQRGEGVADTDKAEAVEYGVLSKDDKTPQLDELSVEHSTSKQPLQRRE